MRIYHERLRVPLAWWLIGGLCVIFLGTELFAGYTLIIGVAIYSVLVVISGATLLHWGGAVVSVTGGELRAARARVPLAIAGEVRPLDEKQTRAMRGPRADPSAYLLIRPYLKQSVYVELTGADARWPYLLICTRQPARLAEAIERSRAAMAAHE
jgi:hypothetical protein